VSDWSQTNVGMLWQPASTPRRAPPDGLPLPRVDLAVPVWLADIAPQAQWPPPRLSARTERLQLLWDAANGHLARWADIPTPYGRYEALVDIHQAILTARPPTAPGRDPRQLLGAAKAAAWSLLTYGRTVVVDSAGVLRVPDMRFVWPVADAPDAWVEAIPRINREATAAQPYAIDLWLIAEGVRAGARYGWNATSLLDMDDGQLGEMIAPLPPVPARAASVDHGTPVAGWGEPLLGQLLPLIVQLGRREASVDYILDRAERPIFTVELQSYKASRIAQLLGDQVTGDDVTPELLQQLAPALAEHDTLVNVDGLRNPQYVTFDGSLDASFSFLRRLDQMWTEKTGVASVEAADSGDLPSGVAFARRQATLVARTREMHQGIETALAELVDGLDWPWIDPLGESAVPPSGRDPQTDPPSAEGM